jgi:hypothetical protein
MTIEEAHLYLSADKDDDRRRVLTAYAARVGEPEPDTTLVPDRVQVLTMHGSKGLSAYVVQAWRPRSSRARSAAGMPARRSCAPQAQAPAPPSGREDPLHEFEHSRSRARSWSLNPTSQMIGRIEAATRVCRSPTKGGACGRR